MAAEGFYRQEESAITETVNRLEPLQAEIEAAYERWEELESLGQNQGTSLAAKY
ncbi:MAG: hypothetical protein ACOC0S_02250 [Desulfohalobiaceae bacterium]